MYYEANFALRDDDDDDDDDECCSYMLSHKKKSPLFWLPWLQWAKTLVDTINLTDIQKLIKRDRSLNLWPTYHYFPT